MQNFSLFKDTVLTTFYLLAWEPKWQCVNLLTQIFFNSALEVLHANTGFGIPHKILVWTNMSVCVLQR